MIIIILLLAGTFWSPNVGSITFIIVAFLLESFIFLANLSKVKIKNEKSKYTTKEVEVIEHYHLFFQYPVASRIFSRVLSGIQISVFVLVPWLLFKGLFIQASIIGINYFIASQLAVTLNPKFFLHDNLDKGKIKDLKLKLSMTEDMNTIDSALEKMYSKRYEK